MEISGFTFSAATLASLGKIDFTEPSTPPALDMLIIDGATMPVATQWAQRLLRRFGARNSIFPCPDW